MLTQFLARCRDRLRRPHIPLVVIGGDAPPDPWTPAHLPSTPVTHPTVAEPRHHQSTRRAPVTTVTDVADRYRHHLIRLSQEDLYDHLSRALTTPRARTDREL
jgi:hypothetical protein